jgi:hypothetical protein
MKKSAIIFFSLSGFLLAISCSDIKRKPGRTYMPDMAYSRAYETYSASPIWKDGQTNRQPVAGTVKRGELLPWHLAADKVGDTANYFASRSVVNPLGKLTLSQHKEAERLYLINCAICHGSKLDGNGPLYNGGDGPYPSKPATLVGEARYDAMPEGQMFYSVTYGKNLMGSYAAQLNTTQRWMVVSYIKALQTKTVPTSDSAAAAPATEIKVVDSSAAVKADSAKTISH